ncbi:protease complex subunit PrcB family protein [Flavobacterium sp. RSB2_4_14]|uniref:protease complex subunit PrcB family protein n=1 Tax=Flavobacterium sp. RSB2_4_14 TaxID=3447665 RepID=UPI003F324D83
MKTFYLTFILLITLNGCSSDNSSDPFVPVTITPVLISKNDLSGDENIPQQNTVVSNQTDWNNLITQMNSINNVSNNFTEINIDFSMFEVIVVMSEVKPNSSYLINIDTVIENEDNITVNYTETGDPITGYTEMKQPYHIVKIPKSPKPVIFQ